MEIVIGKFKVCGAALIALAAAYFFDTGGMFSAALTAAAVHEVGHFAALKICRGRIAELKLELWGLTIRCDSRLSYKTEAIVAAAGPLASLFFALTAAWAGRQFQSQEAYILGGISLIFCIFNMLPALPLDGGKIVYALVAPKRGLDQAERIACVMSCAIVLILLVTGTVLLLHTKFNFTLLLAALWLLISYCKRCGVSIKSKRKIMEVKHG